MEQGLILRDAAKRPLLRMRGEAAGAELSPHGEERGSPRVSNHAARMMPRPRNKDIAWT